MTGIAELRDAHAGETAYVVGRGRSLLNLRAGTIGPGPVIALNDAIHQVRALGLPNPVYTMQKDGCTPHTVDVWQERTCAGEPCVGAPNLMTRPIPPEILLVSAHESPDCFALYEPRYVFDCEADFGVPWYTMSAAVAVRVANLMGCSRVVMIAHDAYTSGDTHRVEMDGSLVDTPHGGYALAGHMAAEYATSASLTLEWVTP